MAVIAFTGKGGVGKTTLAALAIRWLVDNKHGPVLAIDADSNANLNELLGVSYNSTVGAIREETRAMAKGDPAFSKQERLSLQLEKALSEHAGFDLLVMGRPEGPGCYCYANNVLRDHIERLSSAYPFIVADCEAGLEHISRRTLLSIDCLVTVSDQSVRGLRTAARIGTLLEEMKTRVGQRVLAMNRASRETELMNADQAAALDKSDFEWIMALPEDANVGAMDAHGGSVETIPRESPVRKAMNGLMQRIIHG